MLTRRNFLNKTLISSTGIIAAPTLISAPNIIRNLFRASSIIEGVQIGVITYSFRSMDDQSAEATLQYVKDCGINAIELMGDPAESFAGMPANTVDRSKLWPLMRKQRNSELSDMEEKELGELRSELQDYNNSVSEWRSKVSMDKFKKFRKMYNDNGVHIYAFKPRAFGKDNTDAEIDYGLRAAKALGASHVTLEHPSDDEHTLKLGKMAKKHKIYVAYHGHEQQTPEFWDVALDQAKYNAMNPDLGHYVAAGNSDPLGLLKKYHKSIKSIHVKDRQNPENGKENLTWGTGDTPIPEILKLLKDQSYSFPATIELEYKIPENSDAVKEVQNCLEFCRKHLKSK